MGLHNPRTPLETGVNKNSGGLVESRSGSMHLQKGVAVGSGHSSD